MFLQQVAILDIAEEVGKQFTADLNKTYPGKVIFVKCDVGNEDCIAAAFKEVVDKFVTVDIVFNNAGIMSDAPHVWRKMCDVNVVCTHTSWINTNPVTEISHLFFL